MENILNKIDFKIEKENILNDEASYKIIIKIPIEIGWIENMNFNIKTDKETTSYKMHHIKNDNKFVYFETKINLKTRALYHYDFTFKANNKPIKLQNNNYKLSVNFEVPPWAKGKIMYHIFVDRFNKSNNLLPKMKNRIIHNSWDEDIIFKDENGKWNTDFYGGSINGIIEKLDYIKSLGVSIIYLSPIFLSQSNHRYDTADYKKIDPYIGTNNDLKYLCDKAHSKDIKIIIDAVFNHTGNDSKYFNEYGNFKELGAFQSEKSKYFPFYRTYKKDGKTHFDYWWGLTNLPVCDGNSKEWQNYIYGENGIIDLWFSYGIDGLRLDVADELTDEFIEGIRKAVKRNKEDGFILGEVWKNPMHMNRDYLISGKGMDTVMNYQLVDALIRYYKYKDTKTLKKVINEILTEYPKDTINSLMNFTSTHDITRAINIFGTDEFQKEKEWAWDLKNENRDYQKNYKMTEEQYSLGKKIYLSYIYALAFLPGNLSIFYGDEIGMQGLGNLANRRPFTWNNIDNELLQFFKTIGQIRTNEPFLETADLELIDINNEYFVFKRTNQIEEILVYINRSNNKIDIVIPNDYKNQPILHELANSNKQTLSPYGGLVLKKTKKYNPLN
ncbi:MAG: glycoside hydrolase family 13 protein [Bacilli bacterium]|nr:glycoside hydrolase family 13 protein [Bacilli bacterium]